MRGCIAWAAGALLLLSSCSPRVFPVQRDTITHVRTEIVERLVRDTVEVSLPQDSVYVQTKDTTSVLRIRTAVSEASVSGGVLAHSLYSNPDYKPEIEVVYKDRIEYRDTTIVSSNTEVIEVEKQLNGWQKAMMAGGYVLLGAVVLLVVLGILRWKADAAFDAQFSEVSDAVESIEEAVDIPTLYDVLMQIEQVLENVAQIMESSL